MPNSPGLMTLFSEALEQADPVARAAYLDRVCGGDAALRARIEALLAAHAGAGLFLEPDHTRDHPAATPDATGAFVPDAGTVDLPGSDAATGAFAVDAHRPESTATGDFPPDGATGTFDGTPTCRDRSPATTLDTVIAGRYTLVEIIGEGGMGSVFLASQTEPVKRQVR